MRCYAQDDVHQEKSEQNGAEKGADSTGEVLQVISMFI